MERVGLGHTGLRVSRLAMGTVELGTDYGIKIPDDFGRPDERAAIRLLHSALDSGVNFFDTAPAYGISEALLGKAFGGRHDALIATKVDVPAAASAAEGRAAVAASVEKSRSALKKDVLDIVQVHNATPEVLEAGWLLDALEEAQAAGRVHCIGASVYGEEAAISALKFKMGVLQIALNVLDQRMLHRVLPIANSSGTGVLVRSVYLKGVLTRKAQWLPPEMGAVREAVDTARHSLGATWETLAEHALRFCLSVPGVHAVLVGLRTEPELREALDAAARGPLDSDALTRALAVGLQDEELVDPRRWKLP